MKIVTNNARDQLIACLCIALTALLSIGAARAEIIYVTNESSGSIGEYDGTSVNRIENVIIYQTTIKRNDVLIKTVINRETLSSNIA